MNRKSINQISSMILLSVVLQGVNLLRNTLLAANFGASVELDAFNLINNITGTIFGFITFGVATILIPNILDKDYDNAVNSFLSVIYTASFVILLLYFAFKNQIILFLTRDNLELSRVSLEIATTIILSQYLGCYLGVSNAVIQCMGKFNESKIFYTISSIIVLLIVFLKKDFDIHFYSLVTLVLSILNFFMQFYLIKTYIKTRRINFNIKNNEKFIQMIKAFFPIALGSSIYQISLTIDATLASSLGNGMVSILNYATSLSGMISTLIFGNIIAYIYPKLAVNVKNKNGDILFYYITILNLVICLVTLLIFVVGKNAVSILYERGAFTNKITDLVYNCLLLYSSVLPISASKDLIYRYYYVHNQTYTPFINSLYTSIINIVLSIFLSKYFGLYGIVLGTVLAAVISIVMISLKLHKNFDFTVNMQNFFLNNLFIFGISLLTFAILTFLKDAIVIKIDIIALFMYSFFSVVVYCVLLLLLRRSIFKQ